MELETDNHENWYVTVTSGPHRRESYGPYRRHEVDRVAAEVQRSTGAKVLIQRIGKWNPPAQVNRGSW